MGSALIARFHKIVKDHKAEIVQRKKEIAEYEAAAALIAKTLGEGFAQRKIRHALKEFGTGGVSDRILDRLRSEGAQTTEALATAIGKTLPLGKFPLRTIGVALARLDKQGRARPLASGKWKANPVKQKKPRKKAKR